MKIQVSREQLSEGLNKVQSIVVPRSSLAILSNILLHADGSTLTLTATDLDVTVVTQVEAEVKTPGSITLPAKRLTSIISALNAHEVEVELKDNFVAEINAGPSRFKLHGMNPDDFPPLPEFEGQQTYQIDQVVFREMLRSTSYAASTDETRYILNGTLLSFQDERLTVVATDGRRLALLEQEVEFPSGAEADYVVPTKTIQELVKTLKDEGALDIKAADNQIMFMFHDMLIVSKLIEGSFPKFRQVIPSETGERISIERESLLHAVRRVSMITSEQSNSVRMIFANNRVELITETPEIGEARETIPVKYDGEPISVGFNPEFLLAPLRILESDEVALEVTDDLSPGVMKSNIPFLYVIMPVRMQQ